MSEKVLIGWVLTGLSKKKERYYYCSHDRYHRDYNDTNWTSNVLHAAMFTSLKSLVTQLRKIREGGSKGEIDYAKIEIMTYSVALNPENINEGEFAEARKEVAIKKLNIDEVELLGLSGIAVSARLKEESKDSIADFYPTATIIRKN